MPLWEQVKANLVEWYTVAADKTEEVAKIGVRRYDRFGISRDIERQLTELGNLVYNAHDAGRTDYAAEPTFAAIVARIKELENELARKEDEIETIKQEARGRKAAAAAAGSTVDGESAATGADTASPDAAPDPVEEVLVEPLDEVDSGPGADDPEQEEKDGPKRD